MFCAFLSNTRYDRIETKRRRKGDANKVVSKQRMAPANAKTTTKKIIRLRVVGEALKRNDMLEGGTGLSAI
jgi:hypothetical protein